MDTRPTKLFGTIAIAAGYLTEEKLKLLLEAQAEEQKAGLSVPLGELARERRLMTAEQVQHTLLVQEYTLLREAGKRFGARAVKKGYCSEEQVARAIDAQQKEYQTKRKVPAGIEEYLRTQGSITADQIEALRTSEDDEASAATTDAQGPRTLAPEEVTGSLTIEGGSTFPIGKVAILGRLPTCDVVLPEPRCSRQHARIQFDPQGGRHAITDLHTPNGTRVNDKRISGIVLLNPGDRIGIGSLVLRYESQATARSALAETRIGIPAKAQTQADPHVETVEMPPSSPPSPTQAGRPPRKLTR